MNENNQKYTYRVKGFLLIEAVMYLALLSFILGSAVVASYSLIESSERSTQTTFSEDDGNFLMARIKSALEDSRAVILPLSGTSGGVLSLDTALSQPVIFDTSSGIARIKENGFGFVSLTSGNFVISNMSFNHVASVGFVPDSVLVSYDVEKKHFSKLFYLNN